MFVTVVAVMCLQIAKGPLHLDRDCALEETTIEEIITDSDMDDTINFQACMMHSQIGASDWKAHHPIYHRDKWRIARIKCVPGRYELKGRA